MQKVRLPRTLEEHSALTLVAGVDEAGRGPLAGDVVAAAVILDESHTLSGLTDSKLVSATHRNRLFLEIREQAIAFSIARASVEEIDSLNILQASLLAMHRAVSRLPGAPHFVYVDGNRLPSWDYPSQAVVKGDSRIASIAAASILAKVTRDREMEALDAKYPGYGLARHKGYPTRAHMEALRKLGPTPVHRKSFSPVSELLK